MILRGCPIPCLYPTFPTTVPWLELYLLQANLEGRANTSPPSALSRPFQRKLTPHPAPPRPAPLSWLGPRLPGRRPDWAGPAGCCQPSVSDPPPSAAARQGQRIAQRGSQSDCRLPIPGAAVAHQQRFYIIYFTRNRYCPFRRQRTHPCYYGPVPITSDVGEGHLQAHQRDSRASPRRRAARALLRRLGRIQRKKTVVVGANALSPSPTHIYTTTDTH